MTKDELKQVRQKLGMTQADFAETLGIHANTVARFEQGNLDIQKLTEFGVRGLLLTAKGSGPVKGSLSLKDESAIRAELRRLREEITRRRKANHDEYQKKRWHHEAVAKHDQSTLLDWIETELDRI